MSVDSKSDWPFDQPRNCTTITMRQILQGMQRWYNRAEISRDNGGGVLSFDTCSVSMRTLLLAIFIITQHLGQCVAGTSVIPEIPVSKLGLSKALAIFRHQMHTPTKYCVIGIDWCKASEFQPRIGDARWYPGRDHPNEYSWFVTYLFKDEQREQELKQSGIQQRFNVVLVMRIKDDGQIGEFVGAQ
jgi:hypothetical protein